MALDALTFNQSYDIFRTEFNARLGVDFAFAAFSEEDAMAGGVGVVAEQIQQYIEDTFRRVWIGGASGQELDVVALDRWRLIRVPASRAGGGLLLARPSATPGAETITTGDEFQTAPDGEGNVRRVRATADFVMTGTSLTITVESTVTDRGGNSALGTFDSSIGSTKVTPFLDASITFTQPSAIAGGAPAETDEQFRERIRNFIRNRQRATVEAVIFAALSVGGVASAALTEDLINSPGIFNMFIADPDGRTSQTLIDAVFTTLNGWRAAGVGANVVGAVYKPVNGGSAILVEFTFEDNVTNEDVLVDRALRLMLDYTNTLAAGETWYKNMCEGAGRNADTAKINNVLITSPSAASVTATATEIIHEELGNFRKV